MTETLIHLTPEMFSERERAIVQHDTLMVSVFRYGTGVCGLRLQNDRGELVCLPFQGQQVWSAQFEGRNLTMRSMFGMPYPTREFLETFGGFLQHCGVLAVGGPSPQDTHPLHGELPNAPYQWAFIIAGQDEDGSYIGLSGQYQHTVAFKCNYIAAPQVKLYEGSSQFQASMSITNLKSSPMEMMYLAHVNFKPVDNGRLVYSAKCIPEHVRVRASIPSHITPGPGYPEFLDELRSHPERHHLLASGLAFDPEVVFFIDYLADSDGYAHSMQIHPDGCADYIRHRPDQLNKATRWISRTADQDAIALVEPGTAEPEGYLAEKAKGNVKVLLPSDTFTCDLLIGALTPTEAIQMEDKIKQIVG